MVIRVKLVTPITKAIARGQRIILAHGDNLTPNDVEKFRNNMREALATKLIEVIGRINANPATISKLPRGLSSDVYLLGAYLYYIYSESPIEDGVYDKLSKHLLDIGYDEPITESDLRASTFMGKYPSLIIEIGNRLELS